MTHAGYDTFIEVGVGSVLQKLITKIAPDAKSFSVENCEGIAFVKKELETHA
jgi:[acyl-carrier-protein] S-malonyltransferase